MNDTNKQNSDMNNDVNEHETIKAMMDGYTSIARFTSNAMSSLVEECMPSLLPKSPFAAMDHLLCTYTIQCARLVVMGDRAMDQIDVLYGSEQLGNLTDELFDLQMDREIDRLQNTFKAYAAATYEVATTMIDAGMEIEKQTKILDELETIAKAIKLSKCECCGEYESAMQLICHLLIAQAPCIIKFAEDGATGPLAVVLNGVVDDVPIEIITNVMATVAQALAEKQELRESLLGNGGDALGKASKDGGHGGAVH